MFLYAEYLKRHGIKKVPIAEYCSEGSFLFINQSKSNVIENWRLLRIIWTSQARQPGSYLIEISKPVHDGYRYLNHFQSISREFLKWEEYEQNVFKIIENFNEYEFVLDFRQVFLNFWKMFVYVFDSWFSDQSSEIQNWLFRTIDPATNSDYRCKEVEKIIKFLENRNFWVYNHWNKSFAKCIDSYAYWIGDLQKFHERT
jgi:hypothetical protein